MRSPTVILQEENQLLSEQLSDAQKYLVGFNLNPRVSSLSEVWGTQILCDQVEALSLFMKFVSSGNCCIQMGAVTGVTAAPLHNMNIHLNPSHLKEAVAKKNSPMIAINMAEIEFLKTVPTNGVDSVFIFDFIYNLTKEEGKSLLDEALRVASKQVVISNIHPDQLNPTVDIRAIESNVVKQHSAWSPECFKGAAIIRFPIAHNPNNIEGKNDGFFAILNTQPETQRSAPPVPRIIILTELLPSEFQFLPNDLIIGDIKLLHSKQTSGRYFLPMYLSVLARNLDLPINQLRRLIANFDILEAYILSSEQIISSGYEALMIEGFIKNKH
mgnify:CR=1 FL=1